MKFIKYIIVLVAFMFFATPSFASGSLSGFCEIGNKIVYTSNLPSTTKVQQSYPSCTVTVYIYGTTTKATLYSDNSSTPLANPFTATTNGYWSFFAANEIYSVVLSNGGITAPFTLGPYTLVDSATAGTVTGSGTTNTIPVWASSTSLGNSNIVQSNSTTATVTDTVVVTKNLIANSASAAPITGGGQAIVAGNQAKFVASSTTANSTNQSLIEMYSTGSKSVIDSTAAGSGTVLPVEIQFAEVTAIQFPITGGVDMPTSATGVSAANHGRLRYNSGTQTFQVSLNGAAYADLSTGSSGITGSGTTGAIPVFTGSTSLGSSQLTQASTVSLNAATASISVGDTAAPTPLTTGGFVIAIGSGGKIIASSTTTSASNQSLLDIYNNGTYSVIDSTAAGAGVVKPISIQFAETGFVQIQSTSMVVGPGGSTPSNASVKFQVRSNTTTAGASALYVVGIARQASNVAAWYFGNDGNDAGVLATNNSDFRIGQDIAGVYNAFFDLHVTPAVGPCSLTLNTESAADCAEKLDVSGRIRARSKSVDTPSTGKGMDMYYNPSGDVGTIISVDWGSGAVKDMGIAGQNIYLQTGTTPGGLTPAVTIGTGMIVGAPTGSFEGAGTINAAGDIYKNGSAYTNPDYVFEHWATGNVVKFIGNPGAKDYRGLQPLDSIESFARTNMQLPGIGSSRGVFERFDVLLERLEESYLYVFDLNHQIQDLNARIRALENNKK